VEESEQLVEYLGVSQMAVLEIRHLSKSFGGLRAVKDASLKVEAGEIHALIGPNGAGKSTVFNMVSGLIKPDSGEVLLSGRGIVGLPPHLIAARGLGRTFQSVRLFKNISALANVSVAVNAARGLGLVQSVLGLGSRGRGSRSTTDESLRLLALVGLEHRAQMVAKNLPYGEQKRLELARAVAWEPVIVLLDEPTCGMNPTEASEMIACAKSLTRSGASILLVEHNMRVVMGMAQMISVMDFGEVIAEGPPAAIRSDKRVIGAYLGEGSDA
jgi:branched-chain amino acid transport system ATP-binding protein